MYNIKAQLYQEKYLADITDGSTEEIRPMNGLDLFMACAAFGMMINNFSSVDKNKYYYIKKNGICSYDAIEAVLKAE